MSEPTKNAPLKGSPRVAITDYTFDNLDVERSILEPAGARVDARQCKTPAELIDLTGEADAVITQFIPLTAEVVGAMKRARVIIRYGIGVDSVHLETAKNHGIPVVNVPDYCINEVADHTLALMLNATRGIVQNDVIRSGKWGLGKGVTINSMKTLADMTVGVVGFGRIGRQVVQRLRAFGGQVLVSDPMVTAEQVSALGAKLVPLEQIWTQSDAITLHCPSIPATKKLVNATSLAKMKKGVILINVGRGDLADPAAIVDALKSGQVSAAGLDVWDPEPLPADSPLRTFDNVALTAHIASASLKAMRNLRESVANAALRALRDEPAINVVNGVTQARTFAK